jgi:predicted  nucleic acid-binding Zn-ribbon protein
MEQKLSKLRKLLLQAVMTLEDMDQRMLKIEADILSINRWIEKNDDSND